MNKILWMTDIHLKFSNLDVTQKLFDFVYKTLEDRNIEYLVISGDVNDTKSIIRSECLIQLRNFIERIESKTQTFILVGNHDMHNPKDIKFGHSLEILKDAPNTSIIDEPMVINFDNKKVKFIPYTEDNKMLMKELKNVEEAEFLFTHNGIAGAQLNTKGFFDDTSISSKSYTTFSRVFVGHYHNHHELEGGQIVYLGSPFSHSFAEANQDKYVGIINLDRHGDLELVKPGLRQHIDMIVDSKNVEPGVLNLKYDHYGVGNLCRVFFRGTKEDNKRASQQIVNPERVKIIMQNDDVTEERIKFDLSKSKQEVLQKYIDNVNTTLDKKLLVELGKDIMGV